MRLITVKMSEIYADGLDKLVEIGMYPSRSEAIRVAIRDLQSETCYAVSCGQEMEDLF
ncbi:MAG: ribbon-helix-helix domain-containing protein [Candidatus Thorarchaeota archaeon]|jgi:Arc/MetJ-type ribon-helix-helix transcriptional regulator